MQSHQVDVAVSILSAVKIWNYFYTKPTAKWIQYQQIADCRLNLHSLIWYQSHAAPPQQASEHLTAFALYECLGLTSTGLKCSWMHFAEDRSFQIQKLTANKLKKIHCHAIMWSPNLYLNAHAVFNNLLAAVHLYIIFNPRPRRGQRVRVVRLSVWLSVISESPHLAAMALRLQHG